MKAILLPLLILAALSSNAQDRSNENLRLLSINSGGSNASSTSGSVSFSIGQVFFTQASVNSGSVAQGVQQVFDAGENTTLHLPDPENSVQIKAYPNPVIDHLLIQLGTTNTERTDYAYKLFDMHGRIVQENVLPQTINRITPKNLAAATYLLRIYKGEKSVKSFKIIKK